jgi:hypothetical protein
MCAAGLLEKRGGHRSVWQEAQEPTSTKLERVMESHQAEQSQCSRPPALDDLDLIAAADGEASPDVLGHLAACGYCAGRARSFDGLQGILRQRLFRAFCPPTDDLVSYQYRMLAEPRAAAVAAHIAECPHCQREMRIIERAAGDRPALSAPARAVRRIVAELLSPRQPSALVPLYGAARSFSSGTQYAYRADNLELTLNVARAAGRPGQLVMSGTLATDDDELSERLPGATATLLQNRAVLAVAPLDELGGFLFDDLIPGEYSLSLRFDDCEVVVESLAL